MVSLDFHTARQFHPLAMVVQIAGDLTEESICEALRAGRARPTAFRLPATTLARAPAWQAMRTVELARKRVARRARLLAQSETTAARPHLRIARAHESSHPRAALGQLRPSQPCKPYGATTCPTGTGAGGHAGSPTSPIRRWPCSPGKLRLVSLGVALCLAMIGFGALRAESALAACTSNPIACENHSRATLRVTGSNGAGDPSIEGYARR